MVRTVPPLLGASVRFAIAGAILLALVAALDGLRSLRLPRRTLVILAVTGALVPGIGNGLNQVAVHHATSVTVALLNAAVPLWIVLLRGATRDRPDTSTLVMVAIGFAGVALFLLPGREVETDSLGIALALGASVAWAAGSMASSVLLGGVPPLLAIGIQMVAGAIVQGVAGLALGELPDFHPSQFSPSSLAALAYLVSVGGFLSYSIYSWLLRHAPVTQVSTYAFVNPIVAVFFGWLILGEALSWTSAAGAIVVVATVAVIVRKQA